MASTGNAESRYGKVPLLHDESEGSLRLCNDCGAIPVYAITAHFAEHPRLRPRCRRSDEIARTTKQASRRYRVSRHAVIRSPIRRKGDPWATAHDQIRLGLHP
jgi:hypothetical protein